MTCPDCAKAEASRFSGTCTLTCVKCCARLVVSARPMGKSHQEAMLIVIGKVQDSPRRQQILDCIKETYSQNNNQQPAQRSQI